MTKGVQDEQVELFELLSKPAKRVHWLALVITLLVSVVTPVVASLYRAAQGTELQFAWHALLGPVVILMLFIRQYSWRPSTGGHNEWFDAVTLLVGGIAITVALNCSWL